MAAQIADFRAFQQLGGQLRIQSHPDDLLALQNKCSVLKRRRGREAFAGHGNQGVDAAQDGAGGIYGDLQAKTQTGPNHDGQGQKLCTVCFA